MKTAQQYVLNQMTTNQWASVGLASIFGLKYTKSASDIAKSGLEKGKSDLEITKSGLEKRLSGFEIPMSELQKPFSRFDLTKSDTDITISGSDIPFSRSDIGMSELEITKSKSDITMSKPDKGMSEALFVRKVVKNRHLTRKWSRIGQLSVFNLCAYLLHYGGSDISVFCRRKIF